MSLNRPELNNIIVIREHDDVVEIQNYIYMLYSDMFSFKREDFNEESVVSELREDNYCIAHDTTGNSHKIHYKDILTVNEIKEEIDDYDVFPMMIRAWCKYRTGIKL